MKLIAYHLMPEERTAMRKLFAKKAKCEDEIGRLTNRIFFRNFGAASFPGSIVLTEGEEVVVGVPNDQTDPRD